MKRKLMISGVSTIYGVDRNFKTQNIGLIDWLFPSFIVSYLGDENLKGDKNGYHLFKK